ncbi:pentapeptide repeat-containing protein [Nannocystaceae bacterium ST9]
MNDSGDAQEYRDLLHFLTRPGPRVGLALARVDDPRLALRIRRRLAREVSATCRVDELVLDRNDDVADLVERMHAAFMGDALFVVGLERLLLDDLGERRTSPAVSNLNQRRDELPNRIQGRIVVWLPEYAFVAYSEVLRDFGEFVLTVAHFREIDHDAIEPIRLSALDGWRSEVEGEARKRLEQQIEALVRLHASVEGIAAADTAGELASAWIALGELDRASEWTERAASYYEVSERHAVAARELRKLGEARTFSADYDIALALLVRAAEIARRASAHDELVRDLAARADVLTMLGALDEARVLLSDEALPRATSLDQGRAAILDRLADIAVLDGRLDEALDLRRMHQTIVEQLGDERSLARARRKHAAILLERGDLHEALRVLRSEVLPVFERLADEREQAIAWRLVADIEFSRGELDEARRLYEQQATVFERIGDVRERAVTWTRIANVTVALGRVDEALVVLRERARPAFEKLGDVRGLELVDRQIGRMQASPANLSNPPTPLTFVAMTELPVVAPKSVWTRPMKLNLGEFFTAFAKLGVDVVTTQWAEASKSLVDLAGSFGLARTPSELAGLLIQRAAMRAITELIEPYRADFPAVIYPGPPDFLNAIAEEEFAIDERFLEHPRTLPIVGRLESLVEQWLGYVKLEGHVAKTIAARLPARFVYMLHRECIEHRAEYAPLFAELRSEFSDAWQRERSWEEYRHWFESELVGSVFGEDFSLPQIFQWPRAYYVEKPHAARADRVERAKEQRRVVQLRETIDEWLQAGSREDAIRVISGDPGAGKSSFARMYAAHRMTMSDRVLLVPLHMLDVTDDLRAAIESLCADVASCPDDPFGIEEPLLLILDGLDELANQGKVGSRLARDFARQVQRLVERRNQGSLRLQVILSGRPIAVQDVAESDFRTVGQVLHLVAFAEKTTPNSSWEWVDPEYLLAVDQRDAWWKRFGELTGTPHAGLPEALAGESLFETTRQPLLGYLLALVHRDAAAKGQMIERDVTRNEIYGKLIHAVYERDYAKPSRGHSALRGITSEEFDALLEEMALAAWQEDTRVVEVAAVERLCRASGLADVLDRYVETSQAGVAQLFTAFYFRRSGMRARGEETFEFTHKSFAEYLVARRFVAELANAADALAERDVSKGRRARGKDEPAVLLDWLIVFGRGAITLDLLPYLEIEVQLRAANEDVGRWQSALCRLINWTLREGMPCERVTPGLRFVEMLEWANEAERSLMAMLHCCSRVTGSLTAIDWPNRSACKDWLGRLAAKRRMAVLLGRVSMVKQDLHGVALQYANLRNADLRQADLQNADMWSADLENADLRKAYLQNADLWCANLENADLRDADLENAFMEGANLENAKLERANLENADLRGVTFDPEQFAKIQGVPARVSE